jgi:hypothetical protein
MDYLLCQHFYQRSCKERCESDVQSCVELYKIKSDAERFPRVLRAVSSGEGQNLFLLLIIDCVSQRDAQLILEIDLRNRASTLGRDIWIRFDRLSG